MVEQTKPIAESKNFIVLDKYASNWTSADHYQSEAELERELIKDLRNQGYEFLPDLTSQGAMLANVRLRLEELNSVSFTPAEWLRFDQTDPAALTAFREERHLSEIEMGALAAMRLPTDRKIQDYKSTYNDIRDWLRQQKAATGPEQPATDWDDVVFEVDLLKSQEFSLDYILGLLFDKNRIQKDKDDLIDEARRVIRASLGNRAKETLMVEFINQTNLDGIGDKGELIEAFFAFAQEEQRRGFEALIAAENLNREAAKRYISQSLKREFATENGNELRDVLPKMSPLNPEYLSKKSSVFLRVSEFVEKFKGVGGGL